MPLPKKHGLALVWRAGLPTQLWYYGQGRCSRDLAFPSALWTAFAPQSLVGTHLVAAPSSCPGAACSPLRLQAKLVSPPYTSAVQQLVPWAVTYYAGIC